MLLVPYQCGLLPRALRSYSIWSILSRDIGLEATLHSWSRIIMYRECFAWIRNLGPEGLDVLEISPGTAETWRGWPFKSLTQVEYPDSIFAETISRAPSISSLPIKYSSMFCGRIER
jgi:hypothetical protein